MTNRTHAVGKSPRPQYHAKMKINYNRTILAKKKKPSITRI